MSTRSLFKSFDSSFLDLNHRIVLAPMTRIRADTDTLAPTELTVQYYKQRATTGGLLITEATHISPEATPIWRIYPSVRKYGGHVPGIWTDYQARKWNEVTRAVHLKGAKISCQLLHAGRVAQPEIGQHPLVKNTGHPLPPVSSSAIALRASDEEHNQYNWDQPSTLPRALATVEIPRLISDYLHAARNAIEAGFDYVELHAAHGYLIEQFICDGVNKRDDQYGGSITNRCRLLFELVEALVETVGAGRLGVRLSPIAIDPVTGLQTQTYFGVTCSDVDQVYGHIVTSLNDYPLAYLLLTEPRVGGLAQTPEMEAAYHHPLRNGKYRNLYAGTLIAAGGFTPAAAAKAVSEGVYDLIAFGRWFLSNPDLPERLRLGASLNVYDRDTFYGGSDAGYTDYPEMNAPSGQVQRKYRLMEQSQIGVTLNRQE